MRKIALTAAAVALGLSGLTLAGTAAAAPLHAAPVTPDSASCGRTASDRDSRTGHATTAANIRSGSSTSCAALGAAQTGDTLNYYCYTVAGNYTWTYLRDNRTGVKGWVRDDLLSGDGSLVSCGF